MREPRPQFCLSNERHLSCIPTKRHHRLGVTGKTLCIWVASTEVRHCQRDVFEIGIIEELKPRMMWLLERNASFLGRLQRCHLNAFETDRFDEINAGSPKGCLSGSGPQRYHYEIMSMGKHAGMPDGATLILGYHQEKSWGHTCCTRLGLSRIMPEQQDHH